MEIKEINALNIDIFSLENFQEKIISCINEEKGILLEIKYYILLRICEDIRNSLQQTQLKLDIQDAKVKIEGLEKQIKMLRENSNNVQTFQLKNNKIIKD